MNITRQQVLRVLGGEGSGNFGHSGIPGQVGGSAPGGGGVVSQDPVRKRLYDEAIESVRYFSNPQDPEKVKQAVDIAVEKKSFGNKTLDLIQAQTGLSDGAIMEILSAVKSRLKADSGISQSLGDSRLNWILQIRDSKGRTKARRF